MDNLRALVVKLSQKTMFKNVQVVFSSFFLRLIIQSVYFVVLARTFGPEKYGSFIAIVAIISLFIPFANWGSSKVLVQRVSIDRSLFAQYYGDAILKSLVFGSGFVAIVLLLLTAHPLPNISIYSVFFLALANFVFMTLSDNCKDAFVSVGLLGYTSKIVLLLSLNRFVGALALIGLVQSPTLLMWSVVYCIATGATAIAGAIMVSKRIGQPQFDFSRIFQGLKQGFSFSISDSAENMYNDLDKVMLSKLSTVESVAIYGAAYHILNVSLLPMQSLMLVTFRDFFQAGASGIRHSWIFCKKILPVSVAYSVLAILLICILAPLMPKILGEGYADSATALMWLSPTILLKSLHRLAADILTSANYQKLRSLSQVLVAGLNGLLNLWLITAYRWQGAIWATIISEFSLMLLLWGFVYMYYKKSLTLSVSIPCER